MEVQGSLPGPERSKRTYERQQDTLIDANRALVRAAREDMRAIARQRLSSLREASQQRAEETAQNRESARADSIELSQAAQAAAEPSSAEREARVRELAQAHRMDQLHTPERIERAAQRLLEG
jgi:anti-sigma28 factor (negative regulator of flagellin synthesis)